MPISFLNPWFWLGAIALAAPLWLHLRRRQQRNLLRFSAVRFLEDQLPPTRSPLRLRHLLLFLVRALALLLLIAAFTWPYLRGANTLPIRESRVYILDNTFSRQADRGFVHDRDRLVGELRTAGPELQMAVIELTSAPRVVVNFGDARESAVQRLVDLQPSHQRGSYLAAFRQAQSLLAKSLGEQRRIILLSDNQENQWTESISTPPFLSDVEITLPKAVARSLPNLSLSDPRAQRVFLGDKSLVNFTVKLNHLGPARSARLELRANGQTILTRTVDLENQPDSLLVQAQWESDPANWLLGEAIIQGEPDALPADNQAYFAAAPVTEGKVALLAQSPYLRLALSPEIMRGRWAARVIDPAKLASEVSANQDADVLCLESTYLQSADVRTLVRRYLSNSRGVLLLVNRLTPAVEGSLHELGFESEGGIGSQNDSPEKFQFVLSNHPIFHPFLSPDYGNLQEIQVSQYVRLKGATATPLLFGQSGAGLFFQSSKFPGKLFVAGFGLDREHTSWAVHPSFIPFLDLTFQTARAQDPTSTTFEPGEVARIQLPSPDLGREWVLRTGAREVSRVQADQGLAQVILPDQPGIYTLSRAGQETIERVLCVNPPPKESQLIYLDSPDAVKAWQAPRSDIGQSPTPSPRSQIRLAGILQQRLWWWMVVGGLSALLLETVIAEIKKERT